MTTTEDQFRPGSNATEDGNHPPTPEGGTQNVSTPEVHSADADKVNDDEQAEQEPETFPREYVEKLRAENAEHRVKAKTADDLAHRLHSALVAATGRLADPADLMFDQAHLDDAAALDAAIDDLIARKPHLASRRPSGDIGQGHATAGEDVSLAGILRAGAN